MTCLLALLFVVSCPTQAQLQVKLPGQDAYQQNATQSAPTQLSDPEQTLSDLRRRIKEVQIRQREILTALSGHTPPSYASFDELKARQIILFTTQMALESRQNSLKKIEKAIQVDRDLESKIQSWSGFGIEEPYPIGLSDKLAAEIYAKQLELKAEKTRVKLEEDLVASYRHALELAGPKVRKVAESLEKAREKNEAQLRWQLETAEDEQQMAEAQFQSTLTKIDLYKRQISLLEREIDFLREQRQQTRGKTAFTQSDLNARLDTIAKNRETLKKQLADAELQNLLAQEKLTVARDSLEHSLVDGGQGQKHLRQLFELSQVEADTADQRIETVKLLLAASGLEAILWQERFRVHQGFDKNHDLAEALSNLDIWQERVKEYKDYYSSKALLLRTKIQLQEKTLEGMSAGHPGRQIEQAKQDAYRVRMNDLEQLLAKTEVIEFLTNALRDETSVARNDRPYLDRLQISLVNSFRRLSAIWNYEIFSVEDTIIVDGRVISGSRPVTLKKVVYGLLLLTVGIWSVSKLSKLLSRFAQKKLKAERSLILLFEKLGQFVATCIVVVVALGLVQIPFTAFAFLGGALAIAAGFGGQNLINNFISSLILLVEKPIKVGDVVEAEGFIGRVTAIGGRCSTIRRFDGVDLLVPNSHLLEKTVVNRTLSDNLVRYDIKVGVAYGSPVREVFRLLGQIADENGLVLKDPKPVVLLEDFAADALLFGIYYWVEVNERIDVRVVASDLRHRIDRVFRDAGISIAFPQRDVHLDSALPLQVQVVAGQTTTGAPSENPAGEAGNDRPVGD